jgi:hypothetical protein
MAVFAPFCAAASPPRLGLPQHVRLVLSATAGDLADALEAKLPPRHILHLSTLSEEENTGLLQTWLGKAGRKLQATQLAHVSKCLGHCGLPLYTRLVAMEVLKWRSYDEQPHLGHDVKALFEAMLSRLAADEIHGYSIVSRSLGYIAVAKYGLTEDEVLGLLSRDSEFMADLRRRQSKSPPVEALPVVVWSRFLFDVQPYLVMREADQASILTIRYPQLGQLLSDLYLDTRIRRNLHCTMAEYFFSRAPEPRCGEPVNISRRVLSELPYHLVLGELGEELGRTLTDLDFIEQKCGHSRSGHVGAVQTRRWHPGGFDLLADYRLALSHSNGGADSMPAQDAALLEEVYRALLAEASAICQRP